MRSSRPVAGSLLLCTLLVGSACSIEAENPFDPETARDLQAEANVQGRLVVPGRDLDANPAVLLVLENGLALEEDGAPKLFTTRAEADGLPDGFDDGEGAAGTFSIPVPPGTWTVRFDRERNDEPLLGDAESAPVSVLAGARAEVRLEVSLLDDLDLDPPTPGAVPVSLRGLAFIERVDVPLALNAADATVVRVLVSGAANCDAAPPVPEAEAFDPLPDLPFAPIVTVQVPPNNPATNDQPAPSNQCKQISVVFIDDAGNRTAPSADATVQLTLDTLAPDAPTMVPLPSITSINDFTLTLARNARDHHLLGYEVRRPGQGVTQLEPDDAGCLEPGGPRCEFSFVDVEDGIHVVGVRALDLARNTSEEELLILEIDTNAPRAPEGLRVRPSDGRLDLRWDTVPNFADIAGYRVHYGIIPDGAGQANACTPDFVDYTGAFAAQGGSGFDVGLSTSAALTGLPNGLSLCVGVTAYDDTLEPGPNESEVAFVEATPFEVAADLRFFVSGDTLGISGGVGALAEREGLLYLAADGSGLIEVELAREGCFAQVAPLAFAACSGRRESATNLVGPTDIALAGPLAFVGDRQGVKIFNLDDPDLALVQTLAVGEVTALDVGGSDLVVTSVNGGSKDVRFFDTRPLFAASPGAPTLRFSASNAGAAAQVTGVDVNGTHALVLAPKASNIEGIYSLGTPVQRIAGAVDFGGGGQAISGAFYGDLSILGTSNGETRLGFLDFGGNGFTAASLPSEAERKLEAVGPYLYGVGDEGLVITDIRDISNARIVGRFRTSLSAPDLAVRGNRVYVSDTSPGAALAVFHVGSLAAAEASFSDDRSTGAAATDPSDMALLGDMLLTDRLQLLKPRANSVEAISASLAVRSLPVGAATSDRVLGISGGRFARVASRTAGVGASIDIATFTTPNANERVQNGTLHYPWAALHIERTVGQTRTNELWVVDVSQPVPAVVDTAVLFTVNSSQNGFGYRAAHHQGFFYLGARISLGAGDVTDGLWRAAIDPLTGSIGEVLQVETGGAADALTVHGDRLLVTDRGAGVLMQTLRPAGAWDSASVVVLNPDVDALNSVISAYGTELLVPRDSGTIQNTNLRLLTLEIGATGAPTAPFAFFYETRSPQRALVSGDALFVMNTTSIVDVFRLR